MVYFLFEIWIENEKITFLPKFSVNFDSEKSSKKAPDVIFWINHAKISNFAFYDVFVGPMVVEISKLL